MSEFIIRNRVRNRTGVDLLEVYKEASVRKVLNACKKAVRKLIFEIRQLWAALFSEAPSPPEVSATAVYCFDMSAGVPILAKNANFKLAPASLVKLATALVLVTMRGSKLAWSVLIEEEDCIDGSSMGLQPGDKVTYEDLLHGLLLSSGNDAAQAIARTLGAEMLEAEGAAGDPVLCFVRAMNELAASLGLARTRFVNVSGRDSPGQYSTARDLALLGARAFDEPCIRRISGSPSYTVRFEGKSPRTVELKSTVTMLGERGVVCGKTGTTVRSGGCLVLLAEVGGRRLVTALLGSELQRAGAKVIPETDRRFDEARAVLASVADDSVSAQRGRPTRSIP